jgi:hypothetical protein
MVRRRSPKSSSKQPRLLSAALAVLTLLVSGGLGHAASDVPMLEPKTVYPTPAQNLTSDEDEIATDVSGIACIAGNDGLDNCLIVNDEDQFAQFVEFRNRRLVAGARIRLIGNNSDLPIGTAPQEQACSAGSGKFKDLDGEAVSYANGYFYVIGSHGCSRKKNRFHPSAFLLVRIAADGRQRPQATYRLSEVLRNAGTVRDYFAKDLNGANGLNIEGLAVAGDDVFVGLRGPAIGDSAFIVRAKLASLFDENADLSVPQEPWRLKLGEATGIRDLAIFDDGRLLILAGPAQDQDIPFSLFMTAGTFGTPAVPIANLQTVKVDGAIGKAEALRIVSSDGQTLRIAVFFDGLENGGGREYEVRIR